MRSNSTGAPVPRRAASSSTRSAHALLDELAQALDLARPERLGHQLPQAGVIGIVEQHERAPAPVAAVAALDLGDRVRGRLGVVDHRRDREVAQDGVDVVVAGDDPSLQQLGPVHGILGPQAAVLVVGPVDEALLERVEGGGGRGRAHRREPRGREGGAAQRLVGDVLGIERHGDLVGGGAVLVGQPLEQRPVEAVDVGGVAAHQHPHLVGRARRRTPGAGAAARRASTLRGGGSRCPT